MKELEGLCRALKEGGFKSNQAAFNYYYDDFCKAKEILGWEKVIRFINNEVGKNLTINTYKSMFERAKKKRSIKKTPTILNGQTVDKSTQDKKQIEKTKPTNALHALSQKNEPGVDYNPTPDRSKIYGDYE
jgi:hypothetical protein